MTGEELVEDAVLLGGPLQLRYNVHGVTWGLRPGGLRGCLDDGHCGFVGEDPLEPVEEGLLVLL